MGVLVFVKTLEDDEKSAVDVELPSDGISYLLMECGKNDCCWLSFLKE
jgi:hypothetical protein